jgi:hypothetical protein
VSCSSAVRPATEAEEVAVVALSVILFPPLLIAFLLLMERVEEPLRRPASPREVTAFLNTATPAEVDTLATSGIRRALGRWRRRRRTRGRTASPPLI